MKGKKHKKSFIDGAPESSLSSDVFLDAILFLEGGFLLLSLPWVVV